MNFLFKKQEAIRPIHYQWAYDAWLNQNKAHWLFTEIPMNSDVVEWNTVLSENDKRVIGKILKGFAQTESYVNEYWSFYVAKWFNNHEIKDMAITFGAMETIHKNAYQYLNDTLGLTDFETFMDDPAIMDKLNVLMEVKDDSDLKNIALSLAIFSACAEGILLFSSFAILYSFKMKNVLKGVCQQISFSVRDESLHSIMGCKLYRELTSEYPEILDESFEQSLYAAVDLSIKNEFNFIDSVFEDVELDHLKKEQLFTFIYDRANRKLLELNLKPVYKVDKDVLDSMDWFYKSISGEIQVDFFDQRVTEYSLPNEDWDNVEF